MAEGTSSISDQQIKDIITNMALAHELIMDDKFELKSFPQGSLEKHIKDIMHQAFWDILESEVTSEPPVYTQAVSLLGEVKENLLGLVHPQQESIWQEIGEVLDNDLIKQQVDNDAFDIKACAEYVINTMAKLCAPVRDEQVSSLRNLDGITNLFRGILNTLDTMKMDMANFQLKSLKPVLISQSVEYEQKKFKQYIEKNPNGLQATRDWLRQALVAIMNLASPQKGSVKINAPVVVTNAYMSLLEVDLDFLCPETLILDELRLEEVRRQYYKIVTLATIMVILKEVLSQHLTSDESFMKKMKDTIFILLEENTTRNVNEFYTSIYEQISVDVSKELEIKGLNQISDELKDTLKKQIVNISSKDNPVRKLMKSRIRDYFLLSMMSQSPAFNGSSSLLPVQAELQTLSGRFSRLMDHNRKVHFEVYEAIISDLQKELKSSIATTAAGSAENADKQEHES